MEETGGQYFFLLFLILLIVIIVIVIKKLYRFLYKKKLSKIAGTNTLQGFDSNSIKRFKPDKLDSPKTKVCKYCYSTIGIKNKVCPYCNKRQPAKAWVTILALILFLAVWVPLINSYRSDAQRAVDENKVTYENFTRLSSGMSYEDVCEILGKSSEFSYSTNMSIGSVDCLTDYYYWYAPDGGYCLIAFQDGAVAMVTQVGLNK